MKKAILFALIIMMIVPFTGLFAEGQKDDDSIVIGANIYNFQDNFMNGVMAVLLGVIIALVAPRLVPKRRKNSGWA